MHLQFRCETTPKFISMCSPRSLRSVYVGSVTFVSLVQSNIAVALQGDVMTGAIATHLAWILSYQDRVQDPSKFPGGLPPLMLAAWGGCHIARVAAELSFAVHKRSMVAGDVIEKLAEAIDKLYGSKT